VQVDRIRQGLRKAADPAKAPGMQAYLKSAMPCLGVQTPALRRVVREALESGPPADWRGAMLTLWREAEFREERFAALALAHRLRRDLTPRDLPLLEELVVSGAWWDLVDPTAKLIGDLLPEVAADMRRWSRNPNMWKRRVSIICQLGRKDDTRPRLAPRLHRAEPRGRRVLHPQGDRLGASRPRLDEPGVGRLLCPRAWRTVEPALTPRSNEAHRSPAK
jgi:3-methyladenine DNA glycosylase AlkD